jgi:hypothetical protein
MLHNGSVPSAQKFLQDLWVLGEFSPKTRLHDYFLDVSPVRPERLCPLIAAVECIIRSGCADDVLFLGLSLKLLGLEEVFIGGILKGPECEGGGVDVVEFAVLFSGKVEVDRFLSLHDWIY